MPLHAPVDIHALPRLARLLAAAALALVLVACAGVPGGGEPAATTPAAAPPGPGYLERARAQPITHEQVTVQVAALRAAESAATFGAALAEVGVQPVWVQIDNRSKLPYWLMPVFTDRDFYSARETAYLARSGLPGDRAQQLERLLTERQVKVHVPPGKSVSGFIYTNLTQGIKLVNVELLGPRKVLRFEFARETASGGYDYQTLDPDRIYPGNRRRQLTREALDGELRKLPCCTTDAKGENAGDPLNLVMVGTEHQVLTSLVRAGWDFTRTIDAASVGQMVGAFLTGHAFRTAPVSALYFEGRPQDFAMQRARSSVSQRNHLRLWLTPLRVGEQPVWVGQISRDIGVRITSKSPTFTTHVIDPDVDEARDYLAQDMLMTSSVAWWGYAQGVGAAAETSPRANLTGDTYFTDGQRLVLAIAPSPRAIQEAEHFQWRP